MDVNCHGGRPLRPWIVLGCICAIIEPLRAAEPASRAVAPARTAQREVPPVQRPAPPPMTIAMPPQGFPLSPAQQQRVDQILQYWEQRSNRIKTFRSTVYRFDYDPVFGPPNPKLARTQSRGELRYAHPDKGYFRIKGTDIYHFSGEDDKGKPIYKRRDAEEGEYWMCNGQSIFEFLPQQRIVQEMKLPAEMQGKAIADGPLPFMFGTKAETLKQQYWIRELRPPQSNRTGNGESPSNSDESPQDAGEETWLEAYPKLAENAADFQFVRIIFDSRDFLPKVMELHLPNTNSEGPQARVAYRFEDCKTNDFVDQIKRKTDFFIPIKTPLGWKKVVEDYRIPGRPAAEPPHSDTARSAGRVRR